MYDHPTYGWQDNRDPDSPRPSPNAVVGQQIGGTRILVSYGRPGARGRKVFGGLVPYGRIWRTGANEATTLTTSDTLRVQGQTLKAGTYSLFTIPGAARWTIILNRIDNQWGAYDYDPQQDVLRFDVDTAESPRFEEWFSIEFADLDTEAFSATLVLRWEQTVVRIAVKEPA